MTTTTNVNSAYHTVLAPLPPEAKREIHDYAIRTNQLCTEILGNDPFAGPSLTPIVVVHDTTPWWWWCFPSRCCDAPCAPKSKSERDQENSGLAAGLAIAGLIFTVVGLGSAAGRYSNASGRLYDTHLFQNMLERQHQSGVRDPAMNEASYLASLQTRVCSRIKSSAIADLFLRTVMAGSLSAVAAGHFYRESLPDWTQKAGLISTLVTGLAILFKVGCDSTSQRNHADAISMRGSITRLVA